MRFTRFERYTPIDFNARRQAAFARKQQRERDRYPLFSDHVASEQRTAGEEIDRRQRQADRFEASQRAFESRVWRKARTRSFLLPEAVKVQIRAKWLTWPGPTSATNFAYIVDELSGDRARRVAQAEAATAEIRRRAWGFGDPKDRTGSNLMTPTDEQDAVVDAVKGGGALKVKAYAGAGKTSTLRLAADARGRARGLYLAFNKAIATDAARKFPSNTRCRTVHSIAYGATRPEITRKLKNPVEPPHQLALHYGLGPLRMPATIGKDLELSASKVARMVMDGAARFCRSPKPDRPPGTSRSNPSSKKRRPSTCGNPCFRTSAGYGRSIAIPPPLHPLRTTYMSRSGKEAGRQSARILSCSMRPRTPMA